MSAEIDRAVHTLFPSTGEQIVGNVKFFLGNTRTITAENLANELNRADAQIRTGTVKRQVEIDKDLTTRRWKD